MSIGWRELVFSPDQAAIAALKRSWAWLIPEPWTPLLFSILGDVFLERTTGGVFWLNTGIGEVTRIAQNAEQFQVELATELANNWFMPELVARLHHAGKIPGSGQCYTYAIFPVFSEGKYDVGNLNVVPAREHFELSGNLHAQISGITDGQQVRIIVSHDPRPRH